MKIVHSLLIISIFFFSACQDEHAQSATSTTETAKTTENTKKNLAANRVEVLDFYGTHRCETCKAIEANSRYTIETYFAEAQKEGKVSFQVINADEEQNAEIAEKFEATGTSLFLDVYKDGNETIIELTNFAFAKGRDQAAFSTELKEKIEEQLKTL